MSISATPAPALDGPRTTPLQRLRALPAPRPELVGLLVLAAVLNLWSLSTNGWANDYYAAAVRSMSSSWHAFLYNSFDRAGVMTVDKPPLALWVQALSARVFGFSSWSILVPQALMGVASVGLVYDIGRRRFGRVGGTVAGLTLALTPIEVAISRHNNPDALLVLCLVGALWCLVRALEDGRTNRLVWAGVCVGLGFETKMMAAMLVVPALAAAYLYVAPTGLWRSVRQLAAGGAAMAVVGLAWPVLVWLTPGGSRPWVSGTSDNSIWSLIWGYNGVGRLDGQAGGPAANGGFGGGGVFGGDTGPLRLLNQALGGQGGWLLGFAVVGGLAALVASRLRRADERTGWLVAVGGCFATIAVAFSAAKGIFHPYYVSELAPFTALLVGAGVAEFARGGAVARVAAPAAVLAGAWAQTRILGDNPDSLSWLAGVLVAVGVVGAPALAVTGAGRVRNGVLAAVVGLLLVAPATWSAQTLGHATSSTFPAGGPADAGGGFGGPGGGRGPGAGGGMRGGFGGPPPGTTQQSGTGTGTTGSFGGPPSGGPGAGAGGGGMFGGTTSGLTAALAYAKANGNGTVAVSSQSAAASSLINSGGNVVALGGFSGRESEVSAIWLAEAIRNGRIRYVLADSSGMGRNDGRTGSDSIMAIVKAHAKAITLGDGTVLYDAKGHADAIAAAT